MTKKNLNKNQKNPKINKNKSTINVKNCKKKKIYLCFSKFLKLFKIFFSATKKYSLFLNIMNMWFDKSSPVQPNPVKKILEKSQKKTFFFKKSEYFKNIFFAKKKCYCPSFVNWGD